MLPVTRYVVPFSLIIAGFSLTAIHAEEAPANQIFTQRILPIFNSPNPSSCVQCHLSGVELKQYILPSHEKTFLSLRDQGLIDLDAPEKSKILSLIRRGADDPGAALIHAKNRKAEIEAFTAWIQACCADPKLRTAQKLDPKEFGKPAKPVEVIRYARTDRLLESFEKNIWAMRFRCMNCHIEGTPQNDAYRKEFGDQVAWIKKAGPEATMNYLLSSKLIDAKDPQNSLLLMKPLNDVKHKGGKKFVVGDQGYQSYRTWIEEIAAIRTDKYAKAVDLPATEKGPQRFGTDIWLKLSDTQPAWGDKLLEVRVFAWDSQKKAWETNPIATSDRVVWGGGKLWQHNLTLMAENGSERAKTWTTRKPALPEGKYLIKVYVDANGKGAKDWKTRLSETEYVGQIETSSRWPEGYNAMTVVRGDRVAK